MIFQHPFITDASCLKSLHDLICEVKAEVIVEEREADDVEIKVGVVSVVVMGTVSWETRFFVVIDKVIGSQCLIL